MNYMNIAHIYIIKNIYNLTCVIEIVIRSCKDSIEILICFYLIVLSN